MDGEDEGAGPQSLAGVRVLVLFGGGRLFGQERGNIEVFRQLAELGLRARFITSSRFGRDEIQPELDRLGFEWTAAPFGYHWGKYLFGRYFYYIFFNVYGMVVTNWRVLREARRWRPTHLYVANWMHYSYAAVAIGWLPLPLVCRVGDEYPVHTWLHRWFIRKLARRADAAVCISRFIQRICVAAGMTFEKTRVIYNVPPTRSIASVLALPPVPQSAVVLTYLGQISERKGVLVLLDAVEHMIKQGRNLALWIVGDAAHDEESLERLKRRVAANGLNDRIAFLGYIQDVNYVLSRSDIHVCPSLYTEALSNVVPEAKLCRKPSVVFPTGGLPELIEHGVDGYVCRDQTVEALIEGIEFFVTDAVVRRAAGEAAGRSLEEKFGEERFRQEWAEVFVATTPDGA